jgi:hypothetical protein
MAQGLVSLWAGFAAAFAALAFAVPADAGAARPHHPFLTHLSKQPFNARILPAGFQVGFACESATLRHCTNKLPGSIGRVRADFSGPSRAVVVYTIFPDAASARAWFRGKGESPEFSFWRLKQLNVESLPHPRLSGRIPGFADSVIVESSGHRKLFLTGTTSANVLLGNVIVNATTGSRVSTRHGDRVVALQLLKAAVARLDAVRHTSP